VGAVQVGAGEDSKSLPVHNVLSGGEAERDSQVIFLGRAVAWPRRWGAIRWAARPRPLPPCCSRWNSDL